MCDCAGKGGIERGGERVCVWFWWLSPKTGYRDGLICCGEGCARACVCTFAATTMDIYHQRRDMNVRAADPQEFSCLPFGVGGGEHDHHHTRHRKLCYEFCCRTQKSLHCDPCYHLRYNFYHKHDRRCRISHNNKHNGNRCRQRKSVNWVSWAMANCFRRLQATAMLLPMFYSTSHKPLHRTSSLRAMSLLFAIS